MCKLESCSAQTFDKTLPDFLMGYVLDTTDGTDRIGRMVLWERNADADHAEQQQHTLRRRSDLLRLNLRGHFSRLDVAVKAIRI